MGDGYEHVGTLNEFIRHPPARYTACRAAGHDIVRLEAGDISDVEGCAECKIKWRVVHG